MRTAAEIEHLQEAALRQPGGVRRSFGVKFQCPGCREEDHDQHRDNACVFEDGGFGCAVNTAHGRAIGAALGAFARNGLEPAPAATPSPPAGRALVFTSIGDLLAEPDEETRWLVDGRLPSAGLSLLAGKPKAGKSTMARCLALAVARGTPWLGHATAQGPVFYLALEEKRAEVRRHFRAMGATAKDAIFIFCATSPADGLAQLRAAAERDRPVLIIVDPMMKLIRLRDGNDYAEVSRALEPLLTLARETGAHVLAVHHLGKGERSGGDAILGSTAIFAAVDSALMLKRSERYRTLSSIQRYGEDLDEIVIELDPETRTVEVGPGRQEADETAAATAIFDYLSGADTPVEESGIHDAVEGRKVAKQRGLRRLVAEGRVRREGSGRRGAPYLYLIF